MRELTEGFMLGITHWWWWREQVIITRTLYLKPTNDLAPGCCWSVYPTNLAGTGRFPNGKKG